MYPSISVRKEVAHYQLVLGKTLLLSAISSSAPGFLRRAVDDVRGRAGSVLPPQVWLLQETLLPRLFIHFANNFPQGWFLFLLSCASSPHAAVPPRRADARGRLLCAPKIAFQSGSLCAAHGGCVFLFRGWKDLASIAFGSRIVISQVLCNNWPWLDYSNRGGMGKSPKEASLYGKCEKLLQVGSESPRERLQAI